MTKFDLELIKFVDCFLDGHGIYTSNLGPFKIMSFYNDILPIS